MKILVHGAGGHMGQVVCRMAESGKCGARLMAQVSPEFSSNPANDVYTTLNEFEDNVDVVVDFSNHNATPALLDYCIARKFPVVIATTGQTEAEKEMIKEAAKQIPVFFSANMSVGIAVLANIARKAAKVNGRRRHQEIGIHSLRLGNEVGTHEIIITNGNETITLKHEAESRELFAEGALKAAAFLCGKEPGLYTMKDLLA